MSERPIPRFDAPLANFSTAEPTLAEIFFAQMSYSYEPLYDSFVQRRKYGNQRQAGYDPFKDPQTKGYELFATSWYHATSPDHMTDILSTIDKSKSVRAVLADAPLWKQFTTGILDPINVVPIPLIGGAKTVFGGARRVALGTAAIQTGLEVPSQAVDAVRTAEESALNIAFTAFFGGLIGGVAGGFSKAADAGRQRTIEQIQSEFETIRRLENVNTLTRDEIAAAPPQSERRFASDSDQDLVTQIRAFEARGDDEAMAYANEFRKELGLRELERAQVDLKDPYRIMPTWFTESPAFKMVTTPLKRALQSKYPSAVKEKFVELAADAGITLNLHSIGATARQSVFQRSAQSNARWVATHDKLVKLWADETNAPTAAPMDINIGNVARKLSRREDTYENWLDSVSRKRITKTTELTEAESRAIKVLDDYFTSAGSRLEDVGLLGTRKGIDRRIERLEAKIEELNNQLAVAQTKKTSRGRLEASMIEGRVKGLGNKLAEAQQTKLAFEEVGITPKEEDVFFPRFWRADAIRKDRAAFEKIVYDWYETNPYIYEFNSKQAVWEKKKLSTRPEDIMARVKLTTDRILGESDPANVDNIGFGYGRSKHFRHRQLDIPNALVMDFIETNPLAAMKTYAARIEPRYEYARMFGDDVDGVVFDMEMEMIRKGASQKDINRMRRDYMHLYDRIAGAVIRNPDSLSYKAAFVLREFASFSYMGSAGLAALPDFGRILLGYDMGDIIKAIHASTDKTARNMSKKEIRLSGEVIDFLKGSAYLRLQEDMTNNIASNSILNSARNAFYVLNGLTPMTTIAKTLAGMVDSHTIIDHAIRYNKLTEQERTWFARYGFSEEDARRIARAPWHKSEQGLYMANTEQWADSILIPEIENKTLRVIEQNDDGTPVGRTNADGVYVPARYNYGSKTIYFDRDYIEGPYFERKVWLNPRTEGIKPMPDIFKTPKQWSNFVMLHEIMHSRFRPEALGFVKQVEVIKRVPSKKTVSFIRRRQNISGRYFVHFTRKSNIESLLRNGYDVKAKSIFPTGNDASGKLAGDVMYFTLDMNRWKRGDIEVEAGTGTKDYVAYDYGKQEWVIIKNAMIEEDLEPVGAFLADDAKVITIDSLEKYNRLISEALPEVISKLKSEGLLKISAIDNPIFRSMEENKLNSRIQSMTKFGLTREKLFEHLKGKYDAIEIVQKNDGAWSETKRDGTVVDTYGEVFGNSGNHDFFVVNKDKVVFEKEVVDQTVDDFKTVSELEDRVDVTGYENAINALALEEYRNQTTINEELVFKFRTGLNSGILNTIMSGTPADKPIITDGVAYLPINIAKQFGFKEDPKIKGYARVENGFLGLPFQFYSFILANVNKTIGAMAQGQLKNRAIGISTMMGLAYMSLSLRTPDYIWEKMSYQDRFARSFDMSGVMALYSDVFYTAMHTSLALGGPNITGGILSPKFPQEPSLLDAATGLAGAGPSWLADVAAGAYDFASGNYGEGAMQIVRNLPGARMWFLKDDVNQITRAWAN